MWGALLGLVMAGLCLLDFFWVRPAQEAGRLDRLAVAIGAGLPLFVGVLYDVPVPVSGASVGIAFGVSLAVGVFFGLYPARKAADMNIVDALGYE